jgi:hypothetical protein
MAVIDDLLPARDPVSPEALRQRLADAEQACHELRTRVQALEHERAVVRARLGSILELLDVLRPG